MATLLLAAPAVAALKPLKVPPREEATTQAGMKVIVARRGPLPLVAIRLVVRAGSAVDPQGKFGLADFTARLMRRGTSKLSADEISEAVEFVGGSLSTSAGEDYLSVSISAPAEHLVPMLDIMGQLVREPTFPQGEVDSAKKRVLAQLANELDDPAAIAERALVQAYWGAHPYGHELQGRAADVKGFTRDDLVAFHKGKLGPRIATLVVVGELEPKKVFAAVERSFAGWTGGPAAAPVLPTLEKPASAGQIVLVDKPDQTQTQVRIGERGVARGHPDYFPIVAFNTVLGGSFTSRLVTQVRVKRGLSYGIGSHFDGLAAGGMFSVSTFTKTEATREILDVTLAEVAKMRAKGPTPVELATAKSYLNALYPSRIETNEGVSGALADIALYGLPKDFVETFRERLGQVTKDQAAGAARQYLFEDKPVIVLVGNAAKVRPLVEGLGKVTVKKVAELE
ncbi:MAG: M16 family metallopeptidase [Myxococcaceae bacterium]